VLEQCWFDSNSRLYFWKGKEMSDENKITEMSTSVVSLSLELAKAVQSLVGFITHPPKPKLYDIPENIILLSSGKTFGILCEQQELWFNKDNGQYGVTAGITQSRIIPASDLATIECPASDLKPGDVFTFNPNTIYTQEYYLCVMLQSCNLLCVNWKSGTNCGLFVPEIGSVGKGVSVYKVVLRKDYK
jgi:hypothetical protein